MKYNVDEIQKNMHIRQVEGIGDRLEEDIRNILNRAGIYFRIFSRAKTPFSIAQKLEKPGYGFGEHDKKMQDLIGLRVVVYYQDDMDIVRTILEKTFRQVGEWSKTDNTEEEFKASKLMVCSGCRKNISVSIMETLVFCRLMRRLKFSFAPFLSRDGMRLNTICVTNHRMVMILARGFVKDLKQCSCQSGTL